MKISKPKENQILIEDDSFKFFSLNVKSKTGLNKSKFNQIYQGLILAYRLPDMEASKQIFYGNLTSILTLFSSCLENIMINNLINEEQLQDMIKGVKENIKNREGNND